MSRRLLDAVARGTRHCGMDLAVLAVVLGLVAYLGATTLRPVFHNAAATIAELNGDPVAAEHHLTRAIEEARRFGATESLATALDRLARLHWEEERFAEAEQRLEELLAIWEVRLGSRHLAVADVLERMGLAAQYLGELDEAEPRLRRSLAIREQMLGPDSARAARSLVRLGSLYRVQGRQTRADLYLRRGQSLLEEVTTPTTRLAAVLPGIGARGQRAANRIVLAEALYELSAVVVRRGRIAEARALSERAVALSSGPGGSWAMHAASLSQLAALQQAEGESEAALASNHEARRLVRRHGETGSRLHAALLNNLAVSQAAHGNRDHARDSLRRAQQIVGEGKGSWQTLAGVVSANEALVRTAP